MMTLGGEIRRRAPFLIQSRVRLGLRLRMPSKNSPQELDTDEHDDDDGPYAQDRIKDSPRKKRTYHWKCFELNFGTLRKL